MKIAVLVHIDSNDYDKIHALMLSVFSQCHLKKEIFVSVSEKCTSPRVHKLLTGTRDQAVVKVHSIRTVHTAGGESTAFTERNHLLRIALKMGFEGFAFAEIGTIWKPNKLKLCVDKLSAFRIEHYYSRPKLCITDFGFYNLEYARRVVYYCGEIKFEPHQYLNQVKEGLIQPYPLPGGNIVLDRVAALHAINEGTDVPMPYEQWILFVCSLGKSNFYVLRDALFEADWTHFEQSMAFMVDRKKAVLERKKLAETRTLLEAKRISLESAGLRIKSLPLAAAKPIRPAWISWIERSPLLKVWCPKRVSKCVDFLNGQTY